MTVDLLFEWLNGLGFESLSRKIQSKSEYRREINIMKQLVLKNGLGAFNVLIQGKGLPNSGGQYTTRFNFWDETQISIVPTESHMSWNPKYNTSRL